MADVFHSFELLLFRRFQSHPDLWVEWRDKLVKKITDKGILLDDLEDIGEIPQSLWYLSVTLHRRRRFLLELIQREVEGEREKRLPKVGESLLSRYLSSHQFTEFYLDSMFKYGDDNRLPRELFKCPNVRLLSLKYNSLDRIPAEIGRMRSLEYLALTNNKLQVHSLPPTLIFCKNLKTLLLDNNLLDALPGFLLQMPSIQTVHRHGNHNYFKATFMWYHTDVNYRIIPVAGTNSCNVYRNYERLQFWAAKAVISSKKDFFSDNSVAPVLKDYISDIYEFFHICNHCNKAQIGHLQGFKVITFKNPYLGNTCVPFQHWACSRECAERLEVPARQEQIAAAQELDRHYDQYVLECHRKFHSKRSHHPVLSCSSGSLSDVTVVATDDEKKMADSVEVSTTSLAEDTTKCQCSVS